MNNQRIDFDVHAFINNYSSREFTITELTNVYFQSSVCKHESMKSARQYFYRHLQDMVKSGQLIAMTARNGKSRIYGKAEVNKKASNKPDKLVNNPVHGTSIMAQLMERIKENKLALLTSMGETEAYREWADSAPQLSNDVKNLYKASRDKTSKLLGKVAGYESLLTLYQGQ